MSDRPGMTEKEWELLRTIALWHADGGEIAKALFYAQAERDAAAKPTHDEVFRARGEAVERRKVERRITSAPPWKDPLNRLRRNFQNRRQTPTESEVMPHTQHAPTTGSSGHHTTTPPPPQPEGASRRERLHNLIVAKTQHSLWTAYGLADAILADLAAPLSEAEVLRLAKTAWQIQWSSYQPGRFEHVSAEGRKIWSAVVRAIAAELGKGPDAPDLSRALDELRAETKTAEARIAAAEAERDRLRAALEFYGVLRNYDPPTHLHPYASAPIAKDNHGDRARAALQGDTAQTKPEPSPDAELGRMVRGMVHFRKVRQVIQLSNNFRPDGSSGFVALNIHGAESGRGNTLDEAVAALEAELGGGGHG